MYVAESIVLGSRSLRRQIALNAGYARTQNTSSCSVRYSRRTARGSVPGNTRTTKPGEPQVELCKHLSKGDIGTTTEYRTEFHV